TPRGSLLGAMTVRTTQSGEGRRATNLTRRQALGLIGAGGVSTLAGCGIQTGTGATTGTDDGTSGGSTSMCVVTPSETEGPYFVDEKLNRSDIRVDPLDGSVQVGVPLRLKITVQRVDVSACSALAGAQVDVWHCNSQGLYSDESANSTVGKKFLRGFQVTDAG